MGDNKGGGKIEKAAWVVCGGKLGSWVTYKDPVYSNTGRTLSGGGINIWHYYTYSYSHACNYLGNSIWFNIHRIFFLGNNHRWYLVTNTPMMLTRQDGYKYELPLPCVCMCHLSHIWHLLHWQGSFYTAEDDFTLQRILSHCRGCFHIYSLKKCHKPGQGLLHHHRVGGMA